jgi:integrase
MKKIRLNIFEDEYNKLMNSIDIDDSINKASKLFFQRTFTLQIFTGMRVNETGHITVQHLQELISKGETLIHNQKMNRQRQIFASNAFKERIQKHFDLSLPSTAYAIHKSTSIHSTLSPSTRIAKVNKFIKQHLGENYSSHSFRGGMMTELASQAHNSKVIATFMDVSEHTANRYITPTPNMLKKILLR